MAALVSQTVIPTLGKLGGATPMAFTEQGVAMLSSVMRSRRAVQVNIAVMRAFVRLREMLLSNGELARKLADLEQKYDSQFKAVFDASASSWPLRHRCPNPKSVSTSKKTPSRTAPVSEQRPDLCNNARQQAHPSSRRRIF